MRWLLLTAVLVGCAGFSGCSADAPRWHVSGGFLRAPDGRAAILRGANMTGMQKAAPYLDPAGESDYQGLSDTWGFNAIRFVMTWAAIEPARGQYDEDYLDQVAERMNWADTAGLSVILDMHEDIYGEGFGFDGAPRWTCDSSYYSAFVPQDPWFVNSLDANVIACVDNFWSSDDLQARLAAAWAHAAARLAAQKAVIGFDILNEPEWGSYSIFDFEADKLAPFYKRVVSAVRAEAPDWVAFIEPSSSRNEGIPTGLTKPEYHDVVYAPHAYDSAAESSGTFDPTRAQAIADNGVKLASEATMLGAALWIGEYGGVTNAGGYGDYMAAEYGAQGAAAASGIYWDASRGGGYSLFDTGGAPVPTALAAIARPYPSLVAGDPGGYSFDGTIFSFSYRATGGTLPTEIHVPPSLFPDGYHVSCGGCEVDMSSLGVSLRNVPAGPITVEIQP